ncbi:tRNA pseudouridine(13) synthase TruD [Candidatus Woesearchaeota archaeon]|nr:tRNA pseudouridine(13) synthase TruD [Candidatus Woesearchaeota archaeon]
MYTIKNLPEDFVVDEEYNPPDLDGGRFSYFLLKKTSLDTSKALEIISRKLKLKSGMIGYGGMKDKNSTSTQMISIKNLIPEMAKDIRLENMSLCFLGKGSVPVTLGSHAGNRFKITVRNLESTENLPKGSTIVPNYFGEQRFGSSNYVTGKALIKGQLDPDTIKHLQSMDRRMAMIYVHSYQALIFNKSLSSFLRTGKIIKIAHQDLIIPHECIKEKPFPMVGFATDPEKFEPEIKKSVLETMNEEGISFRDFIIRKIPWLTCEGTERNMALKADCLEWEYGPDEIHEGMNKCTIKFRLPKGGYATVLLAALFG